MQAHTHTHTMVLCGGSMSCKGHQAGLWSFFFAWSGPPRLLSNCVLCLRKHKGEILPRLGQSCHGDLTVNLSSLPDEHIIGSSLECSEKRKLSVYVILSEYASNLVLCLYPTLFPSLPPSLCIFLYLLSLLHESSMVYEHSTETTLDL